MKKLVKNTFAVLLAAILIVLSLTACNLPKTQSKPSSKKDIYNFESYKSNDIFDIKKISLSGMLAQKCVTYKFTYMSDGNKIKAYISIPITSIKSQKPAKCIMYNRGGNRDFGKMEDDTTANICAFCDYIVIGSQYRGADGSDGEDQFGGKDLDDVIKLIDFCQKDFKFINMDDFCVAGVSRGGMMTYMAAKKDKRIKRIIAASAVSDLFQSYESREDMREVLKDTIGFTPKEKPSEYKKRSAIYWYDEIKIHVLIIHSKQDEQVSYRQAEELYKKLKKTTDCTFVLRDDDFHGLTAKDAETICDWLNIT